MRVLIVEDEKEIGEVFRDFVAGLGHEPIVTTSAEAALDKLSTEQPDAILLDVRLPGMSGVDFLGLPSVRDSGVPVVAISGVATEGQALQCLKRGALDFLRKPFPLDRLGAVLTYLEPFAASRRRGGFRWIERRPAPRAEVDLPVEMIPEGGTTSTGRCIELSATGMKVRSSLRPKPGDAVTLAFTPADGSAPLKAVALVMRVDRDEAAFWFMDLMAHEVQNLTALVNRLRR